MSRILPIMWKVGLELPIDVDDIDDASITSLTFCASHVLSEVSFDDQSITFYSKGRNREEVTKVKVGEGFKIEISVPSDSQEANSSKFLHFELTSIGAKHADAWCFLILTAIE